MLADTTRVYGINVTCNNPHDITCYDYSTDISSTVTFAE